MTTHVDRHDERLDELRALRDSTIAELADKPELFAAAAEAFRAQGCGAIPGRPRTSRPARPLPLDLPLVLQQALCVRLSKARRTDRERARSSTSTNGASSAEFTGRLSKDPEHTPQAARHRRGRRCQSLPTVRQQEQDPTVRTPAVSLVVRRALPRRLQADVSADARADQGRLHPGRPLRCRRFRSGTEQSERVHTSGQRRRGRRRPPFRR